MLTGCGDQTSEEKIGTFTANFTCNDRHVWVIKSESLQKSTKIADSWQGSKNQNRSSFADW